MFGESFALAFVARLPPILYGDGEARADVASLNAALDAAFPAERLLDFSAVAREELLDGVHLGEAAQARLAEITATAIRRLRPEPVR